MTLLPGYNIQLGLCDEYIAVYDVEQYASDMDCFKPFVNVKRKCTKRASENVQFRRQHIP